MIMKRLGILLLLVMVMSVSCKRYMTWENSFAVHRENLRRERYEATKSYNEGAEQQLLRYFVEYSQEKDLSAKRIILTAVGHMYADYDETLLSEELQDFLRKAKYDL